MASSCVPGVYVPAAKAVLLSIAPTRVKEIALTSSATASINTNASPLIRSKFLLDFFALISLLRYAGKPRRYSHSMCKFGHNAPKKYCYKYNIQDITTECQVILRNDAPFCTSRFAVSPYHHAVQHTICHCERKYGDPAGYCVLAGKRNKQAKDKHFRFLRKMIGQKRSL